MIESVIYILCAALLLFLLWKEYTRSNKGRMIWRILSVVVAVLSLVFIILPIGLPKATESDTPQVAIVLTEGFDRDSVSAFLRNNRNAPVFTLDASLLPAKTFDARLLTDADGVRGYKPHVFGFGLSRDEISFFRSPFIFHPSGTEGFRSIHWPARVNTGDKFTVEGSYLNTSGSSHKIILSGFQSTHDSVEVAAGKELSFSLRSAPKQVGRSVFHIAVLNNKDTLQKQPVPVQVEQGELLRVLVLSSSPDFENKFLKNWLSQKGYPVVIRTTISKNRFSKEFLNMPEINVDRINTSLLDKFDVVLADAYELASITNEERGAIQSHVSQKKAGLIIRADSAATGRSFYSGLFPLSYTDSGRQSIELSLYDTSHSLPALNGDHVQFIRAQNHTRPLVRDKRSRVFSAIALYGSGKILMTSIPNSFSWTLSGNTDAYDEVWTKLLAAASPNQTADESWDVQPFIPTIHEPALIRLQTQIPGIPAAEMDGATVYMHQNAMFPYQWTGRFMPVRDGWQTSIGLNGKPWYWYVFGKQDWESVKAEKRIRETREQMNKERGRGIDEQGTRNIEQGTGKQLQTPNSKLQTVFYIFFLLAAAFLWFENKYYNR